MNTKWVKGGQLNSRFEILNVLEGGQGIVYVVRVHGSQAIYAAKTFREEALLRNPQIADRFKEREALAWIKLDPHMNLTRAHFVENIENRPFLFLEYVSGGDLSRWIVRLRQNLAQMLHFAVQFCDGMEHVLSHGIVAHRDVKPTNCLVTEDRILKVTDFGLIKRRDEHSEWDYEVRADLPPFGSQTGESAGTPEYMAPEQFVNSTLVDWRADLYSFGIMLFEMITGERPFCTPDRRDYGRLHLHTVPPQLPAVTGPEAPVRAELNDLIQYCLIKDPRNRPESFGAVRAKLSLLHRRLTGVEVTLPVQGKELDAVELSNKGVGLITLGHSEDALQYLNKALVINPHSSFAWSHKGGALLDLGRMEEALLALDKALEINPRLAQAWSHKGSALGRRGGLTGL